MTFNYLETLSIRAFHSECTITSTSKCGVGMSIRSWFVQVFLKVEDGYEGYESNKRGPAHLKL